MRTLLLLIVTGLVFAVLVAPVYFEHVSDLAPELPPAGRKVRVSPTASVNVLDRGAGPPVVLVHGHPGTAYDWVAFQSALAAHGHRVLAYDRVGYGRSDPRSDGLFLLEQNARELHALLAAEDLRGITLVGWSYGGGTSIVAAKLDPSRIARMVLVGSIGPGIVEERQVAPAFVFESLIKPILRWIHGVPPAAERFAVAASTAAFAPEPVPAEYLERSAANQARPSTFETMLSEGSDMATPGLMDPSSLLPPVLIVHGDGDQLSSIAIGKGLHERLPDSQIWVVPGAGHMLPITRPEALAERVHAFVNRRTATARPQRRALRASRGDARRRVER